MHPQKEAAVCGKSDSGKILSIEFLKRVCYNRYQLQPACETIHRKDGLFMVHIGNDWDDLLQDAIQSESYQHLRQFLIQEFHQQFCLQKLVQLVIVQEFRLIVQRWQQLRWRIIPFRRQQHGQRRRSKETLSSFNL